METVFQILLDRTGLSKLTQSGFSIFNIQHYIKSCNDIIISLVKIKMEGRGRELGWDSVMNRIPATSFHF